MKQVSDLSALDAISEANKLSFAPIAFQAAVCLRDLGILSCLDARRDGATLDEIATHCKLSKYAVSVLLDMGVVSGIVLKNAECFCIAKIGHFLLHDRMTRTNMDFVRDVCYLGMNHLRESIETGKPAGLKVFGDWPTIYEGLSQLPEPARKSWFNFDYFYSDQSFGQVLPIVFESGPRHIYDLGGNTGRWAMRCTAYDPYVKVTVIDLPQQLEMLKTSIAGHPGCERIKTHAANLLSETDLPGEADVWWMSQFLDCFDEKQIVSILRRIRKSMKPDAKIFILENFGDRQRFDTAAYCLNASSLYFTCMANGNSRFYPSATLIRCIEEAGLQVEQDMDGIGVSSHTLLVCGRDAVADSV